MSKLRVEKLKQGVASNNDVLVFRNDLATFQGQSNLVLNTVTFGSNTVNSTFYTGTAYLANNATRLNGQLASYYANASVVDTAYSNAVTQATTLAGTAYSNAVSVASGDATTKAATAYSNAISYAATIAGTAYANGTTYADTKAATAYSNATSYADTKAAAAYSNAISYSGNAALAYANAIAYAASNSYVNTTFAPLAGATFTGNITINGNTVIGDATTDIVTVTASVNSAIIPNGNNTFDLGSADNRWDDIYGNNLRVSNGFFGGAVSGITTLAAGNTTITGFANVSANLTANNIRTTGSVQIDGDLTVSGNTVQVNVTNLSLEDNMIYLNANNTVSNPDLGFAGNYNDGTYRHAGVFRDATDNIWKFFDQYTPEPDASPYIDTANATFRIADIQANVVYGVTFTGTANNATNLNGQAASFYAANSQLASYTLLTGTKALSVSNTFAAGNTTITGFVNVSTSVAAANINTTGTVSADIITVSNVAQTQTNLQVDPQGTAFLNAIIYG